MFFVNLIVGQRRTMTVRAMLAARFATGPFRIHDRRFLGKRGRLPLGCGCCNFKQTNQFIDATLQPNDVGSQAYILGKQFVVAGAFHTQSPYPHNDQLPNKMRETDAKVKDALNKYD